MTDIYKRNTPPPNETFNHVMFLDFLAQWVKPERYLEIGVRTGVCFLAVAQHCREAIAVDIAPCPFAVPENSKYIVSSSNDFFDNNNLQFDMIFIDGDHSHEQSLRDFQNASKWVIDDGLILLHDTYPINESFIDPGLCNDVWKTALFVKEQLSQDWEVLTLPFHPGVTICKKMSRNKQLLWK